MVEGEGVEGRRRLHWVALSVVAIWHRLWMVTYLDYSLPAPRPASWPLRWPGGW